MYRSPKVITPALFPKDFVIDLAGREVISLRHRRPSKALVMPQIKIRLGAVVGDEDLTVLKRAHGTGVNIDIGIELEKRDLQTAGFKHCGKRGRRYSFS